MRNFTLITLMFFLAIGNVFAQQEKGIIGSTNWLDNWSEFKPSQQNHREPTQILSGVINRDTKLYKKDVYLLMGSVFVTDSASLTIEPGTVIIGDYASKASLTISKGSTIIANGLETDPIVFTSNRSIKRAGDWGGIILLGDAPSNKFGNGSVSQYHSQLNSVTYGTTNFGGTNPESYSGILRYVRIEYAGKRIKGVGYFNGLLLASVGNSTVLENIMVSYSAGNSFEVRGGEVNINKAVSYKTNGIDYKFNLGAQCELSNSIAIRSPYVSSSYGSRCMHVASYDKNKREEVDFTKNGTSVVAKNLTFITDTDDLKAEIKKGLVKEAIYVGKNASLNMNKSVLSGFNPAVLFEERLKVNQENLEKIKFTGMYFNNCNGNIFVDNNPNNEDLENWYGSISFFNVYSKSKNAETFIDLKNKRTPDYRLRINSIIATNDDPDLRND
jgi:hypothetical protein